MWNMFRRLDERLKDFDASLQRSRDRFFGRVVSIFDRRTVDESLWDDLEEALIEADFGVNTTEKIITRLRQRVVEERITEGEKARDILQEEMVLLLQPRTGGLELSLEPDRLNVILVVGVNGTGKTTTIAKLTSYLKGRGHNVALAAGDTFRAAAIEQLKIWGERIGVPVIASAQNADPGALVFDAMNSAKSRGSDVLIVDTAGRLHTKFNLMEELRKINRVIAKVDETAPHEVLLVLDATTGQNAILQARNFTDTVGVTGLVLAKLDGTAKGGATFAVADELGIPIKFVGTGETAKDLKPFDPEAFVAALFLRKVAQ
ncbi:MAG: signal recognition particle-docking protein FtsY [Chloroflexi bacterium]|nr:signal recognition particle-docking protein FtsY [Chloroflexota bacterium]